MGGDNTTTIIIVITCVNEKVYLQNNVLRVILDVRRYGTLMYDISIGT